MEKLYFFLAVLGAIPTAWVGFKFVVWSIAKLTPTKKDDELLKKFEGDK